MSAPARTDQSQRHGIQGRKVGGSIIRGAAPSRGIARRVPAGRGEGWNATWADRGRAGAPAAAAAAGRRAGGGRQPAAPASADPHAGALKPPTPAERHAVAKHEVDAAGMLVVTAQPGHTWLTLKALHARIGGIPSYRRGTRIISALAFRTELLASYLTGERAA